jgi:hypothetical protein
MRLARHDDVHLGYCTNIHAASGWQDVRRHIEACAPELARRLTEGGLKSGALGLGLRLSDQEAKELLEGERLLRFRAFLERRGLYVFTMNGFVHGAFHGRAVKANVHSPDWQSRERVDYTLRLARILAFLLPEGVDGGISTNPITYRPWVERDGCDVEADALGAATLHLVEVIGELVEMRRETGCLIHLDIEPEPDGLIENADELVRFFEAFIFDRGSNLLADRLGVDAASAREHLRDHLQVCLDACHMAVLFEEPERVVSKLKRAGIRIGKLQICSAIEVELGREDAEREKTARRLQAFVEPTYLHQVVQQNADGSLARYHDLDGALEHIRDPSARRWRVHFHVPVFCEGFGELGSTQKSLMRTLACFAERPFTKHLEIETYTWEILPPELRVNLVDSIEREFKWVLDGIH